MVCKRKLQIILLSTMKFHVSNDCDESGYRLHCTQVVFEVTWAINHVCLQRLSRYHNTSCLVSVVCFSLFAGVVPRTLWIALGGSIFLGVYDAAQLLLRTLFPR